VKNLSQSVYGTILNYRIGIRTQTPKECLIQFAHVNSISLASQLIGRKVVWKDNNNKFIGKIVGLHGKKGVVRAKFRKGVPGTALGTAVELVG
jgi:large subunit ribosomal protein L35Ae